MSVSAPGSIDERSGTVLRATVEAYIQSAEPVASRRLCRGVVRLSPASIRTVLAHLEDEGFLFQPHTSAGRIPTWLGYRVYVDELMEPSPGEPVRTEQIASVLNARTGELRDTMQQCASALAVRTGLVGFAVSAPRFDEPHRRVDFVRLDRGLVLGIFTTWSGAVYHRSAAIEGDPGQDELDRLSHYLNDRFHGMTLRQVRGLVQAEIEEIRRQEQRARYSTLHSRAITLSERVLPLGSDDREVEVALGGQHQLLSCPEFSSGELVSPVLEELSRRETWLTLLDAAMEGEGEVRVLIGRENAPEAFHSCSVVVSALPWGAGVDGTVGVLGPTRLCYRAVIALVGLIREYLAGALRHAIPQQASPRQTSSRGWRRSLG